VTSKGVTSEHQRGYESRGRDSRRVGTSRGASRGASRCSEIRLPPMTRHAPVPTKSTPRARDAQSPGARDAHARALLREERVVSD